MLTQLCVFYCMCASTGGWVFPQDSNIALGRKNSDESSTVGSICSTPISYLRQQSITASLPALTEETSEDDKLGSREVHVEMHSELPLTRKDTSLKDADITEPKQYSSELFSRDHCDERELDVSTDVAVTEPDKTGTVSSIEPPHQFETQPRIKFTTSQDQPISLPVQVPYTPESDRAISVPEKQNLVLNLRQPSISSEANVGRRLLSQLSRGGVPPGNRLLTVQTQRGFKLKLIIPSTPNLMDPNGVETNL